MKKTLIVLILMPFLSGCASIWYRAGRDYNSMQPGIYPSVREDAQTMTSIIKKDYDPLLTGAEGLVFSLAMVDIPLALTLDTILLPYDALQWPLARQKANGLLHKYLPGYKIAKRTNTGKVDGAYFNLISPSGETISIYDDLVLANSEYLYPNLNNVLKQQNISISTKDEAVDIVKLVGILKYGTLISGRWEYKAQRRSNLWLIKVVANKKSEVRLGHIWHLEVDGNNILQNIKAEIY